MHKKDPLRPFAVIAGTLAASTLTPVAWAQPSPLIAGSAQRTVALDPAGLSARLEKFDEGRWIIANGGKLGCSVEVWQYRYRTIDGRGRPTEASAALMVPRGSESGCSGPRPVIGALHGTVDERRYNLADLSGNNPASPRAVAWAATYAAHGYVTVAPNYAGFDSSTLNYHPYHDYRQQTADVIAAIDAGRALLAELGGADSGKLFLVGYSQGGWVTMATHRAIEARGGTVTASMPSSGGYPLAAMVDDIFLGRPVQGSPLYFPMVISSYRNAFRNIPANLFNPRYATAGDDLIPAPVPFVELVKQGKVPETALFESAAPPLPKGAGPKLRALVARTGPEFGPPQLRVTYSRGLGKDALLTDAARLSWLQDMARHPDGAWPNYGSGAPAPGSRDPLRQNFIRNDLRGWTPRAPLTMCGGSSDQAVPFHLGGKLMMRYWSSPDTAAPPGRVALIDFDAHATPGDPRAALKANLAALREATVAAKGEQAWLDAYHQITLPRFCYTAAREWFDTMR